MAITLYIFPSSPRSFKALSVVEHLRLPVEIQIVDLVKNAHRDPDYAAINPNMRVPSLRDGDFVLWESNAIIQHLALKVPESGLLPTDERRRIDVNRWQFWDLAHWDPACGAFISERVVKRFVTKTGEPDPVVVEKGAGFFHRAANALDIQLRGKTYVTGEQLTVADFSIAAPLNYARAAGLPLEPYDEIQRWYKTISSLPAWRKTVAANLPAALIAEPA